MTLIPYIKTHATAAQRIAHLRAKGLLIARPKIAARRIDMIGYERLRIYFLSRRDLNSPNRPFIAGTTYQNILRLYECDLKIRNACFSAVSLFELLLRNTISETLSNSFGSHPYHEIPAFRDPSANLDAIKTFVSVYGKSKDQRAKHYRQTYGDPALPPIWTMKEFLTFGSSVCIFQNLEGTLRSKIAGEFGVGNDQVFTSWLKCLVDLRNHCAHHDRLFNRSFQKQPTRLRQANIPTNPNNTNKLKAILECLDFMLNHKNASENITSKVHKIIQKYPEMQPREAGY